MSGALESSPTSSSVATPPSTMRTMQTSLLRSSKVALQHIERYNSPFFQGSLSSTLPTGTTSAKKRKTSSALLCVSTSRTDWPASEFPFTFTFIWPLSLSLLSPLSDVMYYFCFQLAQHTLDIFACDVVSSFDEESIWVLSTWQLTHLSCSQKLSEKSSDFLFSLSTLWFGGV